MTPDLVDNRLIRSYRRLVRCYPPGPRRDEVLDTLIECAAPGRRRPAVRERVNLVCHGGRARLGHPGSRSIVVLAWLIAIGAGFLGAGAANRLGLEAVGSLPVGAEAAEIRQTVFPGLTVWGGGDAEKIVMQGDREGIEYGYATSWVKHTPVTRDVAAYTASTRNRLEAAGWTVTVVDPPLDETDIVGANPGDRAAGFTAERGALAMHFSDQYWPGRPPYDSDGSASFIIWHTPPWWLIAVTVFGALLGALIGWLVTGWTARSLERSPAASALAGACAVGCLLGLLPAGLLALPPGQADETASPFWSGLVYLGYMPALFSAGLALVILGGAVALKARRHLPTGWWSRRSALVLAAVTVAVIVVGVAIEHTGGQATCSPAVPAGIDDPASARLSYLSRVFIDPMATDDQRNLAQAAIGRGFGGGLTFNGGPRSSGFFDAFSCHGRITGTQADALPWYWTVDLDSPGLFGGLAAEVIVMPGVVAVQHVSD